MAHALRAHRIVHAGLALQCCLVVTDADRSEVHQVLGQLLQIVTGACELTEAPGMWHLRGRQRPTGPVGLTELRRACAMFVKHDAG